MTPTLRKHGNMRKWKRSKIMPPRYWENHKKAKAWRMMCFPFLILLFDAASKRPLDNRIRPNGHGINRRNKHVMEKSDASTCRWRGRYRWLFWWPIVAGRA